MRLPRWFPTLEKPGIDLRDCHIYGGLAIAAAGGWQLSPAWTSVALGLALAVMGIFAPRRARGG